MTQRDGQLVIRSYNNIKSNYFTYPFNDNPIIIIILNYHELSVNNEQQMFFY